MGQRMRWVGACVSAAVGRAVGGAPAEPLTSGAAGTAGRGGGGWLMRPTAAALMEQNTNGDCLAEGGGSSQLCFASQIGFPFGGFSSPLARLSGLGNSGVAATATLTTAALTRRIAQQALVLCVLSNRRAKVELGISTACVSGDAHLDPARARQIRAALGLLPIWHLACRGESG